MLIRSPISRLFSHSWSRWPSAISWVLVWNPSCFVCKIVATQPAPAPHHTMIYQGWLWFIDRLLAAPSFLAWFQWRSVWLSFCCIFQLDEFNKEIIPDGLIIGSFGENKNLKLIFTAFLMIFWWFSVDFRLIFNLFSTGLWSAFVGFLLGFCRFHVDFIALNQVARRTTRILWVRFDLKVMILPLKIMILASKIMILASKITTFRMKPLKIMILPFKNMILPLKIMIWFVGHVPDAILKNANMNGIQTKFELKSLGYHDRIGLKSMIFALKMLLGFIAVFIVKQRPQVRGKFHTDF